MTGTEPIWMENIGWMQSTMAVPPAATNKDTFVNDLRRTKNIDQWKRTAQNVLRMSPAETVVHGSAESIFGHLRGRCPFA